MAYPQKVRWDFTIWGLFMFSFSELWYNYKTSLMRGGR